MSKSKKEKREILRSPDPTLNPTLGASEEIVEEEAENIQEVETPKAESAKVSLPIVKEPVLKVASPAPRDKRAAVRKQAKDKALDAARAQIFHRPSKNGLALGEPVKLSHEDSDESE